MLDIHQTAGICPARSIYLGYYKAHLQGKVIYENLHHGNHLVYHLELHQVIFIVFIVSMVTWELFSQSKVT